MRAIHEARMGRRGKTRNDVTMVDPTPAALSLGETGGAGTRFNASSLVPLDAGMIRGRFSGLEKKANTRSSGNGTHCSNSRWLGTLLQLIAKRSRQENLFTIRSGGAGRGVDRDRFRCQIIHWGLEGLGVGELSGGTPCVPMTSPETTISTRRFNLRPAAVLLSATGSALPSPTAVTWSGTTPDDTR